MNSLASSIAARLCPWFKKAARELEWRKTRDPYRIWVSEIMLQQTRVDTVKSYYTNFLNRFPSVQALACADEDEVLQAWSGLGYYRRARFLHRGANQIAGKLGGKFPCTSAELRKIPGIGRYTAGAIASIAFDQPSALVDGNVARVLSRVTLIQDKRLQDASNPAHWSLVSEILEHGSPRILAQALMELGALVCTPRSPKCEVCPVRDLCLAHAKGQQLQIPTPKSKTSVIESHYFALAIRWGRKLLLEKRDKDLLLGGMWCLPLAERSDHESQFNLRDVDSIVQLPIRLESLLENPIKHVFTHRIWRLQIAVCRAQRRPVRSIAGSSQHWITPGEVPAGGLPSITRKMLAKLDFDPSIQIDISLR